MRNYSSGSEKPLFLLSFEICSLMDFNKTSFLHYSLEICKAFSRFLSKIIQLCLNFMFCFRYFLLDA
jgi:hypothetical protein